MVIRLEEDLLKENTENGLDANWFTEAYDYELPRRGEIRKGILLELDQYGALIDIGLKHDGIVFCEDIDKLEEDILSGLKLGQEVTTKVMQARDQEGSLLLSLSKAQAEKDWEKAQAAVEQDEIWEGEVSDYNKGGLLVGFGHLEVFVPASHLWRWNHRLTSADERLATLEEYVGQQLSLKFIEVDQWQQQLIASERLAREQLRQENLETLLDDLSEGQIVQGVVSHITDFGVFVDLGGIDGMIHISELSHRRVQHPNDVVQVGEELDVYVLNLNQEQNRIYLSLKQLEPNPWLSIDTIYQEGQLVTGTVNNVVDYGAFIELEAGVDGLLHVTEIADPTPHDPREFIERGEQLTVQILNIDPSRQRIGLSLKQVPDEVREPETDTE